ncbi:MAG: translesion error-prone DNA polymerase V autoproteolytic subunit [Kiritimatiellaeota bacterium]|nr:translesion error-prone DNA polymerase V autoproteolytic subunit [Kiritimatiellota bacterium]
MTHEDATPPRGKKTLPPLATAAVVAGFPSPAEQYAENPLDLNELMVHNAPATFYVRVAGDSMSGAGILNGDILVVDKSLAAQNNDIVVASVGGDFTVKYLRRRGAKVSLEAANPAYPAIVFASEMELRVWGVATGLVRRFN